MKKNYKAWININPKIIPILIFAIIGFSYGAFFISNQINIIDKNENGSFYISLSIGDILAFIICILTLLFLLFILIINIYANISKNKRIKTKLKNFNIYNQKVISYNKKIKYNKTIFDDSYYYRDIPYDNNLLKAYWISHQYNISDNPVNFFGAVMLSLMKKNNIIDFEKDTNGSYLNISLLKVFDYEYEAILIDILENATKNNKLYKKDLKNWYINHGLKISEWFEYVFNFEEEELIKKGEIKYIKGKNKTLLSSDEKKYTNIEVNENINIEAKNINGLKNFLKSFNIIDPKEIKDMVLLENYIIYAVMLGIGEKLNNSLKNIYPDFIKQLDYINVFIEIDKEGYIDIIQD